MTKNVNEDLKTFGGSPRATYESSDRNGPASGGNSQLSYNISGGQLTISTDGTYSFGTKPIADKPLFFWQADDGTLPNSTIGRKSAWDGTFNGEVSAVQTAPGSTQAVRFDHSASSASSLAQVDFGSSTNMYCFRRRFDDFAIDDSVILRTRYTGLTGTLNIGDMVTGSTSGFTNTIRDFTATEIYYTYDSPIFTNRHAPTNAYVSGETMTTNGGASMTNDEGQGQLIDFNNKHFRMWGPDGNQNDTYIGQDTSTSLLNPKIYEENTSINGAYYSTQWVNNLLQKGFTWVEDQFAYQDNSGANTNDGILWWWHDGVKAWDTRRFNFRTDVALRDQPYTRVYQRQVSNGCRPTSYTYYDQLYIDDSWCRVLITSSPTLDLSSLATNEYTVQPQPPITWSNNQITCHLLGDYEGKHFHIVNSSGAVVASGAF